MTVAHTTTIFAPRRHPHALVIPVLNEGTRIRAQLARLHAAAFAIDVVIADGGSTDGALDPTLLDQLGVRALLVKTGPGRLGAQLRMAYAWCLDQGYTGLLTIDGNGKDGIDAIPAIQARLRDGHAYVQGSRYLPGGAAINTPPDRWLAGRLLHAPLLSLAARRRYTDTTNGFRGYSADYLSDPRVAPFRPIFDRYALLFYLTVRAAQLGYPTSEVPVRREYPPTGRTPTKITGPRARAAMLGELFAVAAGRYAP